MRYVLRRYTPLRVIRPASTRPRRMATPANEPVLKR